MGKTTALRQSAMDGFAGIGFPQFLTRNSSFCFMIYINIILWIATFAGRNNYLDTVAPQVDDQFTEGVRLLVECPVDTLAYGGKVVNVLSVGCWNFFSRRA